MNSKLKVKPVEFTTHRLGIIKLKARLETIPQDRLTREQELILANIRAEEEGVITTHDVMTAKAEEKAQAKAAPAPVAETIPPPPDYSADEKKKPGRKKGAAHGKQKAK